MGRIIEMNDCGKYRLTSTISDEQLHEEDWLSRDEVKKLLIHEALWKFIKKAIEIDMEFPASYTVNGIRPAINGSFNEWMLDKAFGEDGDNVLSNKFEELYNRLDLNFNIGKDKLKSETNEK